MTSWVPNIIIILFPCWSNVILLYPHWYNAIWHAPVFDVWSSHILGYTHYEPPHQDLCYVQIQIFSSLVKKELMWHQEWKQYVNLVSVCYWGNLSSNPPFTIDKPLICLQNPVYAPGSRCYILQQVVISAFPVLQLPLEMIQQLYKRNLEMCYQWRFCAACTLLWSHQSFGCLFIRMVGSGKNISTVIRQMFMQVMGFLMAPCSKFLFADSSLNYF